MLQRPSPKDDDDELIKQNEAFQTKKVENFVPAAQVVRVGKRKTHFAEDINSLNTKSDEPSGESKSTSEYNESNQKKKKEGYVDNTVLLEAVKSKKKSAVLGGIVARDVPSCSPMMKTWNPSLSPHGFPIAPKLDLEALDKIKKSTPEYSHLSLYGVHKLMERKEAESKEKEKEISKSENVVDENLALLGSKSIVVDGESGLGSSKEAIIIHDENMRKLNAMSHEDRLRERNELLSRLSEEQVKFLVSLRQKREKNQEKKNQKTNQSFDANQTTPMDRDEMMMDIYTPDTEDQKDEQNSLEKESSVISDFENEKEEIILSELPISPEEAKKWNHMDKLELNKLKWMTNVPPPKPLKGKEGFVARFNFQGDLLPYDSDISWREGLHHHGEEPGRAGYSLDELFLFVRSQVIQQRHLGLKTLGNIVKNAFEGLYDSCFEVPIIQLMVDAGLVLLLRFAIDDKTPLVYKEALRVLYYLISSKPDEQLLSMAEPCIPSGVQPGFSSLTHSRDRDREELDSEEKELKDVEVIKLDIIRALVRMDTHIRLRYLLESVPLTSLDVLHILGILKRIARHSLTAAMTLVRTPRLIETIVKQFLPHDTTPLLTGKNVSQLTSVYGVPLSQALSFLKVLACRGRHIALTLVENYNIISLLMAYTSMEAEGIEMPVTEVLTLTQEAYYIWSVFLSYELLKAQEGFITFYPLFIRQLLFYRDKIDINVNVNSNHYNYDVGAHLVNVLTKGLCVASTTSLLTGRMKNNEPSITNTDGKDLVLQPPILEWGNFDEIFKLVETCLLKWMSQLSHFNDITFSGFKLLGSFCNFYSVYLENWRDQKNFNGLEFMKRMEKLLPKLFFPLQNGETLDLLIKRIRLYSALCSKLKSGKSRDVVNLESLASICENGEVTPILQPKSPFTFFYPLTKLLKTISYVCPSICSSYLMPVINNSYFASYLNDFCDSKPNIHDQWFSRIEIHSIANILLINNISEICKDLNLYHRTALTLLPVIHKGDEQLIKSLLSDVICNTQFFEDEKVIETQIESLSVKELRALRSPSFQQPNISLVELTKKVYKSCPSISRSMVKNLLHSKLLEKSLITEKCVPFLINGLTLDREEEITVLDHYWCLNPPKMLLLLNDANPDNKNENTREETILSITNCLQMTFFLLKYRRIVIKTHTCSMGWIRHLSNVFLATNDLFLDTNVNSYMQASLLAILENEGYKTLDHSWSSSEFQRGMEWYERMVEHFGSVSYGDSTFAFFIIFPLARSWPNSYKLALFGDASDVLPFIRLTTEEISQFIPIDQFLLPAETDERVILKYKAAVGQMLVSQTRNPFLFEFIHHHLKSYKKNS
ncbi:RNA polymerase II-associated protein 1 [Armadillidium vulgare]|nr:RNA polymerase II-associated protein 1 [Armadillidium vulgare]